LIVCRDGRATSFDFVLHGQSNVVLSVGEPRNQRDGSLGNDFANKHNAALICSCITSADVKTKVYFVEIGVKGNRKDSEELRIEKTKAHETDECFPVEGIKFGAVRDVRLQEFGAHLVVKHGEVTPFGSEEDVSFWSRTVGGQHQAGPFNPSCGAIPRRAPMQNAMCSSRGTPSSSAPL